MGRGYKKRTIEKSLEELKLSKMNFKNINKRLISKDVESIYKIERITEIFVSQVKAKSQFCQISKFWNLIQFWRFGPNFFACELLPLNCNIGSYTIPSLTWLGRTNLSQTSGLRGLNRKFCPIPCIMYVNPTSHGVSDSVAPMGGASEAPPKKSRKESFLTPCCYVAFVT